MLGSGTTTLPDESHIRRGLEGVVVDTSTISKVFPEINALVYRGYPVQELAEQCQFEEVAHLLWHGHLPNRDEYHRFNKQERSLRGVSATLKAVIKQFPKTAHPMDTLRTAMSFLGMEDQQMWDRSPAANLTKAMGLLARIPTLIAADYRCRKGLEIIDPRSDLSISENFFYMCFGSSASPEVIKAFDVSLVLYAEHGFNASTFTSRVVTSTQSDLYSAVVGGICSLKGPLHGGANEAVMHMLKEIGTPDKAAGWIQDALSQKKKIMGFGHRVYKKGDSRAPTMNKYGLAIAHLKHEKKWHEIAKILEDTMISQKGIHPNLDFPAGPAYYLMGFDIDLFTPIFVMSRITGWCAHILEQTANNRLIRPLSEYRGPTERRVPLLASRP